MITRSLWSPHALVAFAVAGACSWLLLTASPPVRVFVGDGTAEDVEEALAVESVKAVEAYFAERRTGLSGPEIRLLSEVVISEAERHGLEPGLVLAVIAVESSCDSRAVSPVGALGLMQIMPRTGKELAERQGIEWEGRETLLDPILNVRLGTAYLKQLSDRYDHVPTALAAYNWGMGRVDRTLREGMTLPGVYVQRVMETRGTVDGELELYTSSS